MLINCELAQVTTLKKGMKVILSIDDKQTPKVMQQIHNFMDKPLQVDFKVNGDEQAERLKQISPEQRKKIYALFKDISSYTGDTAENIKEQLKQMFITETEHEPFSLSDCGHELAGEFIEWLINFAFENGVRLSEHPLRTMEDVDKYIKMCLRHKICAICGKPAEIHHWDTIGMGRDRTKVDDSGNRKISLCRVHHSEAHTVGRDSFEQKYHIYGVVWDE